MGGRILTDKQARISVLSKDDCRLKSDGLFQWSMIVFGMKNEITDRNADTVHLHDSK